MPFAQVQPDEKQATEKGGDAEEVGKTVEKTQSSASGIQKSE